MDSTTAMRNIAQLDLEQIKVKLMHQQSGEGWTPARANAIEVEYRRFLCMLQLYPHENFAPLVDVDTFWHYHILDTRKYAADCQQAFGQFMHHHPYVGLDEEDSGDHQAYGARMLALYQDTFGEPCLSAAHAGATAPAQQTAWCSLNGQAPLTAWCSLNSSTRQTAWCSAPVAAANQPTAWCSAPVAAASQQTAWCSAPVAGASGNTAWCSSPVAVPAQSAAWCSRSPALKQMAWCSRSPALTGTAWCSAANQETRLAA